MTKDGLTPMMRQYFSFKSKYPDKILFFRMGDFYEMFGDDAVEAAPILGIALTSRSGEKDKSIPLCGIPHHAVDKYLPRLLAAGKKVVICEQIEDPKQAKGIVKRDVVEIVTPGISTMDTLLDPTEPSLLTALFGNGKRMALASLDLSTGKFSVTEDEPDRVYDQLRVSAPREVLVPQNDRATVLPPHIERDSRLNSITELEDVYFDYRISKDRLCRFFAVSTLDGFGLKSRRQAVSAAGAILRYLEDNKQERLAHITSIMVGRTDSRMMLDAATVRNLELFTTIATGSETHSLYWAINRTGSAAGARRLRQTLTAPYTSLDDITRRHDAVAELFNVPDVSQNLAAAFANLPDIERISGRIGMGKASPRTLLSLRDGLQCSRRIKSLLDKITTGLLTDLRDNIPELMAVEDLITGAIKDDAAAIIGNGNIIRAGYSPKLDKFNASIKEARDYIASLAAKEKKRTGINSLKVGFNKVFGYYIEVTKTHSHEVPGDYIRKQTLVNAERFITEEMKEKEALILAAEEKINRLEDELFAAIVDRVASHLSELLQMADSLAELDVLNSFAVLARDQRYVRPGVTESHDLHIMQGRHPVLTQIMEAGKFVANDVALDHEETAMILLTGPNMSGKSTWLRQTGLIVILAQAGSFVPAESAEIGIVDRVFTRVGANDNLTAGQSTFLVEMVETANILHNKTDRSLLLLDEVGRGTSTFDGLSVAWAVAETIYNHPSGTPRTLFATHYHEMTGLATIYPRIKNFQVTVKKWGKDIIFLHQVMPGGCDDSYGIEVARLAGVPRETISRAREILRLLESGQFAKSELARGVHVRLNQPTLFDAPSPAADSEITTRLKEVNIDALTPLQALELLAELKAHVETD